MGNIIEAGDLPDGEKVYLKKDFLGWRVVEPWKNPETGKVNWFNLITGGKKNLIMLIILMMLFGLAYAGVNELVGNYKKVAEDPCSFCTTCQAHTAKMIDNVNKFYSKDKFKINLSDFQTANLTQGGDTSE